MIKKPGLIVLFLSSLGLTGHAQTMYVKEKSDVRTTFVINDIRKIIFTGGNMAVNIVDGNPESFALTDVRYVNFTDLHTSVYVLEKQKPELLILFPNPVQDILTINYQSSGETLRLELMTMDGRTVYWQIINQSGVNQTDINISTLPKGMYLCRLINGKDILTSKFLKY